MGQRYQREIEEILDQVNEDAPSGSAPAGKGRAPKAWQTRPGQTSGRRGQRRLTFSSGRLMMVGVVLIVSALLLLGVAPALAAPAAWLGIGLLITGYVVYFTKPRRPVERRWRGEIIEDDPEPNGLLRLWRWLTRG